MEITADNKNERINLRLKGSVKTLIERAAGFEGKTVSNFILNCALERAEDTVRKHETISLNAENSEILLNALTGEINFNKNLNEAIYDHSIRVVSK